MDWKTILQQKDEKPLERLVTDGGFCGILRTIGCVGDSLSSGEFEATDAQGKKTYHDCYDYSWGQFLARMCGSTVYNFSCGGMTARGYCEYDADMRGYWDPEKKCQAYILALGVNDISRIVQSGSSEGDAAALGTVADICREDWHNNQKTFVGYYATVIQRYREIQPDAKFFLMTIPQGEEADPRRTALKKLLRERLYELASFFPNTYVLDFWQYAPVYNAEFREQFYLGGHMNAAGYLLTAQMVASYIDYIIRSHMADFRQIGFVGTPYRNTTYDK